MFSQISIILIITSYLLNCDHQPSFTGSWLSQTQETVITTTCEGETRERESLVLW